MVGTTLAGSCMPLLLQQAEINLTWSAECRLVNIAHSWFLLQFNFNDSCLSEDCPLVGNIGGSQLAGFRLASQVHTFFYSGVLWQLGSCSQEHPSW